MKLPFFKTNINTSELSGTYKNNLLTQLSERLKQQLQTSSCEIIINFIFTSDHGRNGDKFSAILAEVGYDVHYFMNTEKKYQITGSTRKLKLNKEEIKDWLLSIDEKGIKFNCILSEWNIISFSN